MARRGTIAFRETNIRKFIRNHKKGRFSPQTSGTAELHKYYQQCSLVLICAAAGWLEGHNASVNMRTRGSNYSVERFLKAGVPSKEAACLDYICNEFAHIDPEVFFSDQASQARKLVETTALNPSETKALIAALRANFEKYSSVPQTAALPKELAELLDNVSKQLSFTDVERDVFALALLISLVRCGFAYFAGDIAELTPRMSAAVIGKLTGHSEQAVLNVLSPAGSLARVGILDADDCLEGEHFKDFLRLEEKFRRWVASETSKEKPNYELLSPLSKSELRIDDLQHMSAEIELMKNILAGAMRENKHGINVLLVGPPGSGKTETAKVIAEVVGAKLFQVEFIETEGHHVSMDAAERLKSYNLGQRLLQHTSNSVLLFDEIEDVLEESSFIGSKGLARSKAFTNNLLETNPVPTIWITNRLGRMDPAWLRRFSFVLEVPVPSRKARERILTRIFSSTRHKLNISEEMKRRILDVESLSAGQIKVALNALDCGRMHPKNSTVDAQLEILLREPLRLAHGLNGLPKAGRYQMYDISFVNAGHVDMKHVVQGIERNPRARILLSGPPGTGKTGFAHFIAQRLGKPLLRKTAADLLGSFVGQTEQAIARMFIEAQHNDSVLLLDEADGLMRNRSTAVRQWEVTQVNELLSRMEDFPGIFFCSTNHMESLDPAAIRRFLFRLEFNYLSEEQAMLLLRTHVKSEFSDEQRILAGETMRSLHMLTPADFTNVGERLQFLGLAADVEVFLRHLKDEMAAKLEDKERRVGFA